MVHSGKIKFLLYVVSDVFKGKDIKNENLGKDDSNSSSEEVKKDRN